MRNQVERKRRDVSRSGRHKPSGRIARDDERLVRERFELAVAGIDREHDRSTPSRVRDSLEQRCRRVVGCNHDDRLTAARVLQPGETDSEVLRGFLRWSPADERRCQLGNVEPACSIVEMRGEVPRLVRRRADEQESTRVTPDA